jgi:hypothetical protein
MAKKTITPGTVLPKNDLPTGLAAPARRALAGAGYTRLAQLSKITEAELIQLHGIGPNALKTLRRALADRGLAFAPEKKK